MVTAIALSIARPVRDELTARPFSGKVFGRFEHACNLVDRDGRVIALTLPEVGNGPFSIVVTGNPDLFRLLSIGQEALAGPYSLTLRGWQLNLRNAKVWEPKLACSGQPLRLNSAIISIIKPYADWPYLAEVNSFGNSAARLADAAAQLNQAVTEHEGVEKVLRAVGQLAGLGGGLTPAGDDYLVGVMAALWLTGDRVMLSEIAKVACPKTTTLSAAFLKAAAQGEFLEPWHTLVQTLIAGEVEALSRAAKQMGQFGASSGLDALAGFSKTLLSRAICYY